MEQKRTLPAKQIVSEIKSGVDDDEIKLKYNLTTKDLQILFDKLLQAGLVTQAELEQRPACFADKFDLDLGDEGPVDAGVSLSESTSDTHRAEDLVDNSWECPACGKHQTTSFDECPKCGVIVRKYLEKQARERKKTDSIPSEPQTPQTEQDTKDLDKSKSAPQAPDLLDNTKQETTSPFGQSVDKMHIDMAVDELLDGKESDMGLMLQGKDGKTLFVDGDVIRIKKQGLIAGKSEKTIPIRHITSVKVKKQGLFAGFIQFSIIGGKARDTSHKISGGTFDAVQDENAIMFNRQKKYEVALKIKDYVESWLSKNTDTKLNSIGGQSNKSEITKGPKPWFWLVLAAFVLGTIGSYLLWDVDYKIKDGVAKVEIKRYVGTSIGDAAETVLEQIYRIAHKKTSVEKIEVALFLDKEGISDSYGKKEKADLMMGNLVWNKEQVDGMRKYQTSDAYSRANKLYVSIAIKGLKYSYLLKE